MSENYGKTLFYINQALEILEDELSQKQERSKRQNLHEVGNMDGYTYDKLNIKTLTINKGLEAKQINGVDAKDPEFKEIHSPKLTIKNKYLIKQPKNERSFSTEDFDYLQDNEVLDVGNLHINGKLNDYTWQELLNYTIKRKAEVQFIKSNIKIRNLKTHRLVVTNNEVNHQHLSTLIPIDDDGEYVINQDVQFAAPVRAKNVEIHERLNNVHVHRGRFDVLLRRSNETQIIEGPKSLNNVKVMEPITIAVRCITIILKFERVE